LADHIRLHLEEDPTGLAPHLVDLRPADLADVLNQLSLTEAGQVLALLPLEKAIAVCNEPFFARRGRVFEHIECKLAAQLLAGLRDDQRIEIIRQMSPHERHNLLPELGPELHAQVEALLKYPDNSAGGIMTTEFVTLEPQMSVGEALGHVRILA